MFGGVVGEGGELAGVVLEDEAASGGEVGGGLCD